MAEKLFPTGSSLYSYETYFGFSRDYKDHVFYTNAKGAVFIIPRLWRKGKVRQKFRPYCTKRQNNSDS